MGSCTFTFAGRMLKLPEIKAGCPVRPTCPIKARFTPEDYMALLIAMFNMEISIPSIAARRSYHELK